MEENSGKERMKILTNITNMPVVEDREQDYQFNSNSCSEETEVRSSSASKRNENKENPSLMKRMLRGSRSVKQLPKPSNPPLLSPSGDVPDGGKDGRKACTTTNADPEAVATGGARPKSSTSGIYFIRPVVRHLHYG